MAAERRIAILGCGKIGEALLAGLLSTGWRTPDELVVTVRRDARAAELRERHGVDATTSNTEAVRGASVIVIAVKPQDFDGLLGEIGGILSPDQTVLSIAAAVPTSAIEERITAGVPVLRAMPNTPATVHEGVAGLCAGAHAGDEHLAIAEDVLTHVGRVVRVPERYMDAVTAVSGSGPAYVFLLAEAMARAGAEAGLPADLAARLARATVAGAGELLHRSPIDAATLRQNVTSPGGTTAAALELLMAREGLEPLMTKAIAAATRRSRELAG